MALLSHNTPAAVQARLLRSLLREAARTEFGRRYGFAELLREGDVVRAYQARVPLHTYDDLREDLARVRRGDPDVLWPGQIRHFAVSSGTASVGKILPRSHAHLRRDARFSVGVGLRYLLRYRKPGFLFGRHLSIPGRIEPDLVQPGAVVGEVSGLVADAAPAFFRHLLQAVPNRITFLPGWEEKLDRIAVRVEPMDIRLIAMVPSWASVLFRRVLDVHRQRTGRGVETIGEVWPNLQVFVSGGVALSSYREALAEGIGLPTLDFIETYGASEGFFSFQDDLADSAMRLHLRNGVFFEFVPLEMLGQPDALRLTLDDVEVGPRYVPFVSTVSGLWSYGVGDVIRFTRLSPDEPPKIVVAGRTREVLDRYGEAVHADEALAAFEHAQRATGAHGADFHVSSYVREGVPVHRWLIEFTRAPEELACFARALDQHLLTINRHYTIRREAGAFHPPEVVMLPEGTFLRWLRATRERVGVQTKVPRMSEDPATSEALLQVARSGPSVFEIAT